MKARYRPYHPEEGYFTLIDPEDIKKRNPLLKAIDAFVEEHISVDPFSQGIKNEAEGAPAARPWRPWSPKKTAAFTSIVSAPILSNAKDVNSGLGVIGIRARKGTSE